MKRESIFPLKKGNKRGCKDRTKSCINNPLTYTRRRRGPLTRGDSIYFIFQMIAFLIKKL
jgi:hypothetical protein